MVKVSFFSNEDLLHSLNLTYTVGLNVISKGLGNYFKFCDFENGYTIYKYLDQKYEILLELNHF